MLPMLIPMLTNVIGGLVADSASNLAKEHVMDMVDKVVPPEAKAMIDKVVAADPTNPCPIIPTFIIVPFSNRNTFLCLSHIPCILSV